MDEFIKVILKGTARNANERFPIRFDYSEKSGEAFFIGCRVEAQGQGSNGGTFTNRMDVRAFGEVAEQLAHVIDGMSVHLEGTYGMNKGKDEKYYPIVTITEVIEA